MKNHKRLYSLYYRNRKGGRRWNRATEVSLSKYEAIRHFQNRLILGISDAVREWRLRSVN